MTAKAKATQVATLEPRAGTEIQSVHPGTMITALMARPDVDVDKLSALFELQLKYDNEIARKAYHTAKAKFAGMAPTIINDGDVDFKDTQYKFATLAGTLDQIREALQTCGLHTSWKTDDKTTPGTLSVTCYLTHELGFQEETSLSADKQAGKGSTGMNSLQATKSTASYLERITLYALLGLASKTDDDDGRSAVVEVAKISTQQLKSLTTKIAKVGAETAKLLELFQVETLADLKVDQYQPVHALLAAKEAADKNKAAQS